MPDGGFTVVVVGFVGVEVDFAEESGGGRKKRCQEGLRKGTKARADLLFLVML